MKIGCHEISIKYEELESDNASFDWNTNTITISSKLPPDQMFSALIHEWLHVCNSTLDSDTMGHALLDSIAEQLAQIMLDNKVVDKRFIKSLKNKTTHGNKSRSGGY